MKKIEVNDESNNKYIKSLNIENIDLKIWLSVHIIILIPYQYSIYK